MTLDDDLALLYGSRAASVQATLDEVLERHRCAVPEGVGNARYRWSERDSILITYADSLRRDGEAPLATLASTLAATVGQLVNTVHLLPFYPWTSDDGFSVSDYLAVDPAVGTWQDVSDLGRSHRLMFDAVINHVSASSRWFRGFLADEQPYVDWFRTVPEDADTRSVVRPRTSPLLTKVTTRHGPERVWTTFSADQVDLDYSAPGLLLAVVDILLRYVERGARVLRLDAVTYLWKELGTSCVHLPQTHAVIRVLRAVLDEVAPGVTIITETNVPHAENVGYFGDGHDEAQLVYNFALPPLVLHSFFRKDATRLGRWAAGLSTPSEQTCMFNFLASHDGIGVRGAEGLLPDDELAGLAGEMERRGGLVGYRAVADGAPVPYELNVNFFDALNPADEPLPVAEQVRRFMTAQSIMLVMPGVPGIYVHSLLGSRGWPEGVSATGMNRSINREKLDADTVLQELAEAGGRRSLVLESFLRMLRTRTAHDAFAPHAPAEVLTQHPALFVVRRCGSSHAVRCVHNVSDDPVQLDRPGWDLLTGEVVHQVPARGCCWLEEAS